MSLLPNANPMDTVTPGFTDPVFAPQAVFRRCLERMSHPGSVGRVDADAVFPAGVHPAAGAVLLALLDPDTRLWLSPGVAHAATYFRFHTGCPLVPDHAQADFCLVSSAAELPPLEQFAQGSEDYPDRSATLVLQLEGLEEGTGWVLTGPGIRNEARLDARGLAPGFLERWAANRRRFPCGVDLFLASGASLAALPRTTRVELPCT